MVHPVFRECTNNAENMAAVGFELILLAICVHLMDSDLLPSFITLNEHSYFKI